MEKEWKKESKRGAQSASFFLVMEFSPTIHFYLSINRVVPLP